MYKKRTFLSLRKFPLSWIGVFLLCASGLSAQRVTVVQGLANNYLAEKGNHALVVGIVQGDSAWISTFGELEAGQGIRPDAHTRFHLGSISGVFTASVMTAMAEEGDFFPDDPIDLYLPAEVRAPMYQAVECSLVTTPGHSFSDEKLLGIAPVCFPDPDSPRVYMTLCNLAGHHSALPAMPGRRFGWNPFRDKTIRKSPYTQLNEKAFWQELDGVSLKKAPGDGFVYSEWGLSVLGACLARKSKMEWSALLDQKLLTPLNMQETGVYHLEMPNVAPGHRKNGKMLTPWEAEMFAPAAGLAASGNDLLSFLKANVGSTPGELSAAFAECQAPRYPFKLRKKDPMQFAGYGWLITPGKQPEETITWTAGGTSGHSTYMALNPVTHTGVFVLSNSANSVQELGKQLLLELVEQQQKWGPESGKGSAE